MRHYMNGAYFPIGGADAFAAGLVPVIEKAVEKSGLEPRVAILVEEGAVAGVRGRMGRRRLPARLFGHWRPGAILRLLPVGLHDSSWAREIIFSSAIVLSYRYVFGVGTDIRARGATSSNHWFYETLDIADGLWRDPANRALPARALRHLSHVVAGR